MEGDPENRRHRGRPSIDGRLAPAAARSRSGKMLYVDLGVESQHFAAATGAGRYGLALLARAAAEAESGTPRPATANTGCRAPACAACRPSATYALHADICLPAKRHRSPPSPANHLA
jgi:hypothetical protein